MKHGNRFLTVAMLGALVALTSPWGAASASAAPTNTSSEVAIRFVGVGAAVGVVVGSGAGIGSVFGNLIIGY